MGVDQVWSRWEQRSRGQEKLQVHGKAAYGGRVSGRTVKGRNGRESSTESQRKAVPDGRVREQCVGIEEGVIRDVITAQIEEPWGGGKGLCMRLNCLKPAHLMPMPHYFLWHLKDSSSTPASSIFAYFSVFGGWDVFEARMRAMDPSLRKMQMPSQK